MQIKALKSDAILHYAIKTDWYNHIRKYMHMQKEVIQSAVGIWISYLLDFRSPSNAEAYLDIWT
jgi:hypothetical protein